MNAASLMVRTETGMFDFNFTGPADARPGDVLFWASSSAPSRVIGRGKALIVDVSAMPTVRITFTGMVTAPDGTDAEMVAFDQSVTLGVARTYPRFP